MKIKNYLTIAILGLTSLAISGCNTSGVVNMLATGDDEIIITAKLPITTNEGYTMDYAVPVPKRYFLYDLTYTQAFARRYMELWNEDMAAAGASGENFFDLENEHRIIHLPDNYRDGVERNFRRYNMYNVIKKDAQKYRNGDRRFWKFVGDQHPLKAGWDDAKQETRP